METPPPIRLVAVDLDGTLLNDSKQVTEQTAEDEVVITDSPYLAFLANRMVPPRLVDQIRDRLLCLPR